MEPFPNGYLTIAERNANANLIAAAPDLLAACEELMATGLQLDWPMDTTIAKIEAAIAKARGE